jgi:precorrin-2 dehydrogenase / sirohydrochlorin ferrochelatase
LFAICSPFTDTLFTYSPVTYNGLRGSSRGSVTRITGFISLLLNAEGGKVWAIRCRKHIIEQVKETPMNLFPIFLKLEGRRCLVIGAGAIGEEKIKGLLRRGADVEVVAPKVTRHIRAWARAGLIRWHARNFRPTDLERAFLIVAATSSHALHEKIYKEAKRRAILCNVADDPPHCDFYYGAVVQRGSLQIAVSTGGHSPALAQRLRKELERQFGPEFGDWLEALGEAREKLFARAIPAGRRKRLLHQMASLRAFKEFVRRRRAEARRAGH